MTHVCHSFVRAAAIRLDFYWLIVGLAELFCLLKDFVHHQYGLDGILSLRRLPCNTEHMTVNSKSAFQDMVDCRGHHDNADEAQCRVMQSLAILFHLKA